MYDCCNHGYVENQNSDSIIAVNLNNENISPEIIYVLMFKKTKGDIMMWSSKKGYFSYGQKETGGFFTSSFLQALDIKINLSTQEKQQHVWQNIANVTKKLTDDMCINYRTKQRNDKFEQNPQFRLNVATEPTQNGPHPFECNFVIIENDIEILDFIQSVNEIRQDKINFQKLKSWNKDLIKTENQILKQNTKIWLVEPPTENLNDW